MTKSSQHTMHNQKIRRRCAGASMVEYALLLAMIAIICLGAMRAVGNKISDRFSQTGSYL